MLRESAGVILPLQSKKQCKISGFRRETDEKWALLGYYWACSGNFVPTFRDNVSVPPSRFKNPRRKPATELTKSGDLREAQVDVSPSV
jgi:hypothetical protein